MTRHQFVGSSITELVNTETGSSRGYRNRVIYYRFEEGGIGPQPHPNFIEVFRKASIDDGEWALAGAGEDRT